MISLIAAIDLNNAIGYKGELLFRLKQDMQYFKATTLNHTIIMGRNTFASLNYKPLPNRRNIIISSTLNPNDFHNVEIYPQIPSNLPQDEEHFIIGGEQLYRSTIDMANLLYITRINAKASTADTFFPSIDPNIWTLQSATPQSENGIQFSFERYIRKQSIL